MTPAFAKHHVMIDFCLTHYKNQGHSHGASEEKSMNGWEMMGLKWCLSFMTSPLLSYDMRTHG